MILSLHDGLSSRSATLACRQCWLDDERCWRSGSSRAMCLAMRMTGASSFLQMPRRHWQHCGVVHGELPPRAHGGILIRPAPREQADLGSIGEVRAGAHAAIDSLVTLLPLPTLFSASSVDRSKMAHGTLSSSSAGAVVEDRRQGWAIVPLADHSTLTRGASPRARRRPCSQHVRQRSYLFGCLIVATCPASCLSGPDTVSPRRHRCATCPLWHAVPADSDESTLR